MASITFTGAILQGHNIYTVINVLKKLLTATCSDLIKLQLLLIKNCNHLI